MQLIRRIEINYLRSLYKATLDHPGDINVIFGRNDSGKSNVLRALNLFFNEEVMPGDFVDFALDFSDVRREQARLAKGKQFIAIRIDFNVPANYRKSLGNHVSVKRQWNIDGEMTEIPPRNMKTGPRIQLSRFLNQIDFTYIPAIKDFTVFGDLIERMYRAAAESKGLQDASETFVDAIRAQTSDLSQRLSQMFSAQTRLAAPPEMGQLFRSLDFAHGDDGHSLLRQKGDGVKARHLPELLRYINESETKKKFFIWGFEEPENSLDLGAADAEARNFARLATRADTQIFITSHSPAFYLANAEGRRPVIRRVFVSKQALSPAGEIEPANAVRVIDRLEDAEASMEGAGLLQLPYLIRRWKELAEDRDQHAAEAQRLRETLDGLRRPTLFVEGRVDRQIFETALLGIGVETGAIQVRALEGTPASTIELVRATGGLHSAAPVLFLFDNDGAGRKAFRNLCSEVPGPAPATVGERIGVWVLPQTAEHRAFRARYNIRDDQLTFPVEFLFPGESMARLCASMLSPDALEATRGQIHDSYHRALPQSLAKPLREAEPGTPDWLWSRGVPDEIKVSLGRRAMEQLDISQVTAVARTTASFLGVTPTRDALPTNASPVGRRVAIRLRRRAAASG